MDVRATPDTKAMLEGSEELEVLLCDYKTVCRMCDAPDAGIHDIRFRVGAVNSAEPAPPTEAKAPPARRHPRRGRGPA